jgi:methionyl-tRNA synthetase
MSWGVPVPGDEDHVMYVWFDALTNYISTLGWPDDKDGNYKEFWLNGEKIQLCGKDNTRQQSMMWQAMLLVAGIPNTDHVVINGFLNGPDGQKMSKSIGNVINPKTIVDMLGIDALRFYLIHDVKPFDDSPISVEMIKDSYLANLVNGLGNLTNRILKMVISYDIKVELETKEEAWADEKLKDYHEAFANFEMNRPLIAIMGIVKQMDTFITQEEPFKKIKTDLTEATKDLQTLLKQLLRIAIILEPFMPGTSDKMISAIRTRTMPKTPLFPRLD